MTTTPKNFTTGSISHGTLRAENLLPAFLFACEDFNPNAAARFNSELIGWGFGHSMCGVWNRDEWPEGFDEDTAWEILDDMISALNDICPEGVYFGAHYGDGSDFGFWEIEPEMIA